MKYVWRALAWVDVRLFKCRWRWLCEAVWDAQLQYDDFSWMERP